MKLLDETDALYEIRSLLAAAETARLAVAFWGAGAIERLGLNRTGLSASILCNLDSGACNPRELRRINALPGITLRSHPKLHAKVYWTAAGAVLGSSNASTNGLALEGSAEHGWSEANLRVNDQVTLDDIKSWFEKQFAEGYPIHDADLDEAEVIWRNRAQMAPSGTRLLLNLLTAYHDAPKHPVWKKVKLVYWHDDLDAADKAWLATETTARRMTSTSAYSGWGELLVEDDWVLDFDLSGNAPSFGGIWHASPKRAGRAGLLLVDKCPVLQLPTFGRLSFDKHEAAVFFGITHMVLASHSKDGRNAVVDLPEAMALLSSAPIKPSEKAFTRAMEQIYDDAAAFGYHPTRFRQMLAEYGGVETARRLNRGTATSGLVKLWEHKRLDLSVEALMLKPEWKGLFSAEEQEIARKRLRDYRYIAEA